MSGRPKTAHERRLAQASNELGRALKKLRDGVGEPFESASAAVDLAALVSPTVLMRHLRELDIQRWAGDLRSGDVVNVAKRSRGFRETQPTAEDTMASDSTPTAPIVEPTVGNDGVDHPGRRPAPPARSFRPITVEQVLAIHFALVADFAETPDPIDPPGVKSPDLLDSAVSRQYTSLGGIAKYKTLAHLAASVFYGIALNHPFHNGNKRTALVALICLADLNDLNVTASEAELYDFVLDTVNHRFKHPSPLSATAATDAEVAAMAGWITQRLKRKEHFQRMVRWRDLKSSLRRLGVELQPASGSQIELTRGSLRTVVDFDGDTREVGPAIVRKIRKEMHLTPKDGCDDDVFFSDALPLDIFIAKYRGLLRQLAYV